MKQKLFKSLLAVAMLCVGVGNAWGGVTNLLNIDYSTTTTPAWTVVGGSGSISDGKWVHAQGNGGGNRSAYLDFGVSKSIEDNWTVEFDLALKPGSDRNDQQVAVTGANTTYTNNTSATGYMYFAVKEESNGGTTYTVKIGDTDVATGVTLSNGTTYHITVTYDGTSDVSAKIGETNYNGTVAIANVGKLRGLHSCVARYNGAATFDNILVSKVVSEEVVSNPSIGVPIYAGANRNVTITSGVSSEDNTVHTYYTLDGSDPTALSAEYTETLTVTENCTLKAITISTTGVSSSIVSRDITVGKLTLNAPAITVSSFSQDGLKYHPTYTFTSDQSGLDGSPVVTYSYSFAGGASTEGMSYTALADGSLTVTVSAEGYNSNSTIQDVFSTFTKTYSFDAINDVTVDTSTGDWTNPSNVSGVQWTFTDLSNCTYSLRSDITLTTFRYARKTTLQSKEGLFTRLGSGSIGFDLEDGEYIMFTLLGDGKVVANSSATSQPFGQYTNVRAIEIFTPATEADIAILDCKRYETSAAFATAVAGESFSSAEEVYAFHTAWQIAQAKASSSNDITKVIRNAAIDESGTDWANARTWSGEKYTGAPDNYYLDQYQATIDAYQTIYGLPAGSYKIKAATRGSAGASGNIYVYAEGQADANTAINTDGNTGGTLDNGWSWTEVEFTLTATSDVKIGFWADASASSQWAGCDDWRLEITGVTGTIPSSGLGSLASAYGLDFSSATVSEGELTAYVVNEITVDKAKVTPVNEMPANSGVILEGTPGATYSIPVKADAAFDGTNYLQAAVTSTDVEADEAYILQGGLFHLVTAASTVPAGKAYLLAENVPSNAKALSFDFGDADAISDVRSKMEDGRSEIFNLAGQRMSKLQRGVNIVNGKKILVK